MYCVNYIFDQIFGLRLQSKTLVLVRNKKTHCIKPAATSDNNSWCLCDVGMLTVTDFIHILYKYYRSPQVCTVSLSAAFILLTSVLCDTDIATIVISWFQLIDDCIA